MCNQAPLPVRRRRVFYIPGYDPFPPRRYRELYRREAAKQAAISGYDIAIKPGLDTEGFGWRVAARIGGQPVRTDIEVLGWSDLVRQSRPRSVLRTYRDLLRTVWIYLSTGTFMRLMRLRKGPVIVALYPVLVLLVQAVLCALLGWAMVRVVLRMAQELQAAPAGPAVVGAAIALGGVVTGLSLRWFRDHDNRFFAYYLMHDFAYSAQLSGAYPAALEQRLGEFRGRIAAALHSDVDEVLVVGHSSGAHLAVSVLSDLLRDQSPVPGGPALALLSLGQVVPMISFLPRATRLRRDLRDLSQSKALFWVDVTAPGDGGCFALCDPVAVSGQATTEKCGPLVISAAFTQSLLPETWRALRWRFLRLHFQYLCAFDRPKDYDYFQITAGPALLRDRYAGRQASQSRLEKAQSAYVTVVS